MFCILCGNCEVNLFEIRFNIRDDVIEIFGARIENSIEDQSICKPCSKLLEKLAILKRRLRYLILTPFEDRKPVNLKHIWKLISALQIDEDDGRENRSIPTPTPSSLYTVSHCRDYFECKPTKRSEKKRGHRWTRKKRSSSSASNRYRPSTRASSRSRASTPSTISSGFTSHRTSRANTPNSDISGLTSISQRSRRSMTVALQENRNVLWENINPNKIYCPEKNCSVYYMSLDLLNIHIQRHHKTVQLHYCSECEVTFSSKEHLRLHSKQHDFSPFFCLMCGEPQENRVQLQYHLDQHMIYSARCCYCDKSYLSEDLLKTHYKYEHIRRKKEKINFRKRLILDRVEKDRVEIVTDTDILILQESNQENDEDFVFNNNRGIDEEPYDNRRRLQEFKRKRFRTHIAAQNPDGLELTRDNLLLENIEFYSGDGYEESQHRNTEDDNVREQNDNRINNSEDESGILRTDGSNLSEEMDTTDHRRMQETSGSVDHNSNNGQELVNGISDGNDTDLMSEIENGDNDSVQQKIS